MFAMLNDAEQGMPPDARHPLNIMTLIAVLREEAQAAPKEKKSGTGRYGELGD